MQESVRVISRESCITWRWLKSLIFCSWVEQKILPFWYLSWCLRWWACGKSMPGLRFRKLWRTSCLDFIASYKIRPLMLWKAVELIFLNFPQLHYWIRSVLTSSRIYSFSTGFWAYDYEVGSELRWSKQSLNDDQVVWFFLRNFQKLSCQTFWVWKPSFQEGQTQSRWSLSPHLTRWYSFDCIVNIKMRERQN